MGLGLGSYVDAATRPPLGGVTYLAFLAPGLLAATAMQSAAFEAAFPIMGGLEWSRIFHAMYATPISPRDIALGNLLDRRPADADHRAVFTLVIVAVRGGRRRRSSCWPSRSAVLTGMAFAAPIAAFSATQKTPDKFNALFRFVITPLFLFSGTFFPVESLPLFLQPIAWLTPLWHGVSLTRALSWGRSREDPVLALVHLVFLVGVRRRRDVARGPDDRAAGWCADDRRCAITPRVPVRQPPLAAQLIERNLYVYKHGWLVIFVGLLRAAVLPAGHRLRARARWSATVPGPGGEPITYQLFVAPALLASSAMNGAITESTFNFFFKLNYNKTFDVDPVDAAVARRHRDRRAGLGAHPRRAVRRSAS